MINAALAFIWGHKRILGPALAVLAVLLAIWGAYRWAKAEGREQCRAEYAAAQAEAKDKAQKQIGGIINDHNAIIDRLPPGADHPAPAVDAAIDGLRARRCC